MNRDLLKIKQGIPSDVWDRIVKECKLTGQTLSEYFNLTTPVVTHTKTKLDQISPDITYIAGRKSNGKVKVVLNGASRFYNASEYAKKLFQEEIDRQMQMQPVKQVEPTLECEQLTGIEFKRALAVKYIKKYKNFDQFLKNLSFKIRRFKLSEPQCDVAIRIGKEYKEMEKQDENERV